MYRAIKKINLLISVWLEEYFSGLNQIVISNYKFNLRCGKYKYICMVSTLAIHLKEKITHISLQTKCTVDVHVCLDIGFIKIYQQ